MNTLPEKHDPVTLPQVVFALHVTLGGPVGPAVKLPGKHDPRHVKLTPLPVQFGQLERPRTAGSGPTQAVTSENTVTCTVSIKTRLDNGVAVLSMIMS